MLYVDSNGHVVDARGDRTHDELSMGCQLGYTHVQEFAEECDLFHQNPEAWEARYGHRVIYIDGEPVGVVYPNIGSHA